MLYTHSLDYSFNHWLINTLGGLSAILLFGILFSVKNQFQNQEKEHKLIYYILLLIVGINIIGSLPSLASLVEESRFMLIAYLHFLFLGLYLPFIWALIPQKINIRTWGFYGFMVLFSEAILIFPSTLSNLFSTSVMWLLFIAYFGVFLCICIVHLKYLLNKKRMTLKERDKAHLWHPLTQHKLHPDTIAITKAKGCILTDENGNEYIDAISSWYTCMYGHCNDYITSRVSSQMQQLDQVVFSGFTHEPAVKLSEALIQILPENQNKIFFSDNGSTSVEIGIKMALQYHFNKGEKRNTLIAFEDGFHGDTFGAMSVSGLSVYNGPFEDFFLDVKRIPTPNGNNHNAILETLKSITENNKVAGFVYEPIVQGAAAMKMHDAKGLNLLLEFCQAHNIITVADEVMTGFGKTGKYFASLYMETKPDVMCLSKALNRWFITHGTYNLY